MHHLRPVFLNMCLKVFLTYRRGYCKLSNSVTFSSIEVFKVALSVVLFFILVHVPIKAPRLQCDVVQLQNSKNVGVCNNIVIQFCTSTYNFCSNVGSLMCSSLCALCIPNIHHVWSPPILSMLGSIFW